MGRFENIFLPLFCAAAHFRGRTRMRAVDQKHFLAFSHVLYQNETTAGAMTQKFFFSLKINSPYSTTVVVVSHITL
jgi:hypothetical protein